MQQPGGTNDERALVVAAHRRALSACAQLQALHQQDILRLAFLWTGDQPRAVALAEQTFARAMLELPRLDPDVAFRPWLLERLASEALQRPLEVAPGAPTALAAVAVGAGAMVSSLLHGVIGGSPISVTGGVVMRASAVAAIAVPLARRMLQPSADRPLRKRSVNA